MNISKTVLVSILLLGASTGVFYRWAMNVNVTNFPLDEEGNIKVSIEGEPLRMYKDAVSIKLLSFEGGGSGIYLGDWQEFVFVFSPPKSFANVTDVWIGCVGKTGGRTSIKCSLEMNGQPTSDRFSVPFVTTPFASDMQINDVDFQHAIEPDSINVLRIRALDIMYLFSLSIFIEYEYQA